MPIYVCNDVYVYVRMCVCVYMYVCMNECTYIVYMYVHMSPWIYHMLSMYVYRRTCMPIDALLCMYMYVCACMCTCIMHSSVCVYNRCGYEDGDMWKWRWMSIWTETQMSAVWICTHTYLYIYMCVYACIYIMELFYVSYRFI